MSAEVYRDLWMTSVETTIVCGTVPGWESETEKGVQYEKQKKVWWK